MILKSDYISHKWEGKNREKPYIILGFFLPLLSNQPNRTLFRKSLVILTVPLDQLLTYVIHGHNKIPSVKTFEMEIFIKKKEIHI